jgi:hypothetical protein
MIDQAASRSMRQSTPITSPPASRMAPSSPAVSVPKWMTGASALRSRSAARECAMT